MADKDDTPVSGTGARAPAGSAGSAGAPSPATGPAVSSPAAPTATVPADVADFLRRLAAMPAAAAHGRGRLVFAMDATMSRQPTWDMALATQASMFEAVKAVGGLDVQLVYFRGHGECRASRWVGDPAALARLMTTVECRGGYTQIGKVLVHARRETQAHRINALVYVGDCMEEAVDEVCMRAGELALHGVPAFLFQEGSDATAEAAFREIARLTHGAWCRLGPSAAEELRALLSAVAVYAAGGRAALERLVGEQGDAGARRLVDAMRRA